MAETPPPGTRLMPINLDNTSEQDALRAQREACGWGQSRVLKWREAIAKGERTMFWIALPAQAATATPLATLFSQTPTSQLASIRSTGQGGAPEEFIGVGHISLDMIETCEEDWMLPDPTLTSSDGSVLLISSLFVLSSFSGLRLGAFAMDTVEDFAQRLPYGRPNCRAVTLSTMSPRHLEGGLDGPDGMGIWARVGVDVIPRGHSKWYTRRGYVPYKDVVKWHGAALDGSKVGFYGVCMRKDIGSGHHAT